MTRTKKGSIDTFTLDVLVTSRSCCVVQFTFRRYVTPFGKLLEFGVLLAEKIPRNSAPTDVRKL